ncbi:MAG: hypothetical protein IBJ18_08945 [Phycisphaerales bacterium]|nr:hypothetical protein [Phycisphaerales bacterium]
MSESAHVTNVDALRDFKRSAERFIAEINGALAEVDSSAQRTLSWLSHDQLPWWQQQVRVRQQKIAQARSDLLRKQLSSMQDDPSCVDERKALERAKESLATAEEKVREVKKWLVHLDREYTLYRGAVSALSDVAQRDMVQACLRLVSMIRRLEEYAQIGQQPPTSGAPSIGDAFDATLGDDQPVDLLTNDHSPSTPGTDSSAEDPVAVEADQSAQTEMPDLLARLRRLCPSEQARASAPINPALVRPWSVSLDRAPGRVLPPTCADGSFDVLAGHSQTGFPPSGIDGQPGVEPTLTLAPGVLDGRDWFVIHQRPADTRDTGIYIGTVEFIATNDPSQGLVRVPISWFLQVRPWAKVLLSLPIGYLSVIIAGSLAAVLDETDARLIDSSERADTLEQPDADQTDHATDEHRAANQPGSSTQANAPSRRDEP